MTRRSYSRLNRHRRRSPRHGRAGAAAVEMAAVLPLFILLVFGIIEFGRALMVHEILVNAAREGARYAVTPNATDAVLESKINSYLSSAGITGYTVTADSDTDPDPPHDLTIVDGGSTSGSLQAVVQPDDEITVVVSVPYSSVSFGFAYLIDSGRTFSASVVMRKE